MWKDIWTNSWPFMITTSDFSRSSLSPGLTDGGAFSSGLLDSPSPAYRI